MRRATQFATLPRMSEQVPAITSPDVPREVPRDERGRWKPGVSPNPSGRSRSDLEVAALLARLTPRALEVLGQRMEEGDLAAAKAITSLGIAPPKSRPVRVDIGPLRTAQECVAAIGRISEAVSSANTRHGGHISLCHSGRPVGSITCTPTRFDRSSASRRRARDALTSRSTAPQAHAGARPYPRAQAISAQLPPNL